MNHLVTLEELTEEMRQAEYREILDAQAIIFRHGNSQANAGEKTFSPGTKSNGITPLGLKQAELLAEFIPEELAPSLFIISRYLRTDETSRPLRKKFPNVPVEVWDIQEFTYLDPQRYAQGSTQEERAVLAEEFWKRCDPEYRDGVGTESFRDLWFRVMEFRSKLKDIAPRAFVFSHGQFMRMNLMQEEGMFSKPTPHAMKYFWEQRKDQQIPNTTRMAVDKALRLGPMRVSHLPKELIT